MAHRLTPRKSFFGALMFLVFPHTGISNKEISISQTNEEAAIILTCHLSGNMKVIQTSWVMSPNRTNVGTFHPVYGTHVLPQYTEHVEILSDPPNSHRSSLRLKNGAMNGTNLFCCVFTTFPSGTLDCCTDINHNTTQALTQEKTTGDDHRFVSRWALLTGGSILSLIILSMSIFFCWRNNVRRAGVFEIQSAYLPDPQPQPEPEADPEPCPQPTPALGFDPFKLYAKIKEDLYYGRLWRSYQGRPQT